MMEKTDINRHEGGNFSQPIVICLIKLFIVFTYFNISYLKSKISTTH